MAMIKRGSSISAVTVLKNWGKEEEDAAQPGALESKQSPLKKKTAKNK